MEDNYGKESIPIKFKKEVKKLKIPSNSEEVQIYTEEDTIEFIVEIE